VSIAQSVHTLPARAGAALRALPVPPMCGWRDPWLARAPRMVQPNLASTKEAAQKTSWSSDALLQFGL